MGALSMDTFLPPRYILPNYAPLTPAQMAKRASAVIRNKTTEPSCRIEVHVGVFFDGTNNNRDRDQLEVLDPNQRSHSNIVVLHDAFADKRDYHYPIYLPGVGTKFKEIGENTENSDGKAMARGGEARIHWAMIQLVNSLNRAVLKARLIQNDEAKALVLGPSFLAGEGLLPCGDSRRRGVFLDIGRRLKFNLTKQASPTIGVAHLHVFGFSRGAAEARAFCNWMNDLCEPGEKGLEFFGVPLRFQFVGLFDTVASVGLANSAPVPNDGGFMGWADGTMELPASIERCVHLTAAHEIRKSFPLSTGRKSHCMVEEFIYPGSHSDVGGGYAPGEQGKGKSRAELLSQVPLIHMFKAAIAAGVPLMHNKELEKFGRDETIRDLKLDPRLQDSFNEYLRLRPGGGEIRKTMFEHLRLYWRWRLAVGQNFKSLSSYQAASEQDREDLAASEADFLRDVRLAVRDEKGSQGAPTNPGSRTSTIARYDIDKMIDANRNRQVNPRSNLEMLRLESRSQAGLSAAENAVLAELRNKTAVPPKVAEFFDRYVHDSHASFYMLGPVTAFEKKQLIESIKKKKDRDLKKLNSFERRVYAYQETHPGQLPVITDADYPDLLDREGTTSKAVIYTMTLTRRESEGHVRERAIFDES